MLHKKKKCTSEIYFGLYVNVFLIWKQIFDNEMRSLGVVILFEKCLNIFSLVHETIKTDLLLNEVEFISS